MVAAGSPLITGSTLPRLLSIGAESPHLWMKSWDQCVMKGIQEPASDTKALMLQVVPQLTGQVAISPAHLQLNNFTPNLLLEHKI